jgi:hypothetical protein
LIAVAVGALAGPMFATDDVAVRQLAGVDEQRLIVIKSAHF